ncbi:MAG: C40 family peptidase [Clostridium sp.]|nr:C40 family peptidase [Clostridium sp.]
MMATGIEYANRAMSIQAQGCGYIYGASGALWTQAAQNKLVQSFVDKYGPDWKNNAAAKQNNRYRSALYGSKWIGKYVYDCSGLTKEIAKMFGISLPHGSNSQFKGSYLSHKGIHNEVPPVGALLFKSKGTDFYHVGVYVGAGRIVEAQGTQAGVVISTDLGSWSHYGLIKGIQYDYIPSGSISNGEPSLAGTVIVDSANNKGVNLRTKPSTANGKVILTVPEGAELEVVADSGEWCKVHYALEGYVMKRFLKEGEPGA